MDPIKNARSLDVARAQNERAERGPETLAGAKAKLYDKIKARVSVRTMDLIIGLTVAAIIVAVVVGIVIG